MQALPRCQFVSVYSVAKMPYRLLLYFFIVVIAGLPTSAQANKETRHAAPDDTGKASIGNPFVLSRGPRDAPIVITEFADFLCPFCARMGPVLSQLESSYPGQVRIVFKSRPLDIHPNSMLAHEAALAAAQQGKFWEMHDAIFAHQRLISRPYMFELARQIGLDMNTFQGDFNSRLDSIVQRDAREADQREVEATPTFFVNGTKVVGARTLQEFEALINNTLSQKVTRDVLPPSFPLDTIMSMQSPTKGATNPKVTIEEFVDAECPYCSRSIGLLNSLIVSHPGEIALRFRHFPLPGHEGSVLAHLALIAAEKQGKFWEMHDLVFAHQDALTRNDLIRYATEVGLDENWFGQELGNPENAAVVDRDRADGESLGVDATPTFFINGKKFVGVPSGSAFARLLDAEVSAANERGLRSTRNDLFSVGPHNAPVVLVWDSDLESAMMPDTREVVEKLIERYPADLRVVVKSCPLQRGIQGLLLYEALYASAERGRAWQMLKLIAENPHAITPANLVIYAERLGFSTGEFAQILEQHKYLKEVQHGIDKCQAGRQGSPLFFVNEQRFDGLRPVTEFMNAIEAAKGAAEDTAKQFARDRSPRRPFLGLPFSTNIHP